MLMISGKKNRFQRVKNDTDELRRGSDAGTGILELEQSQKTVILL